MGLTHQEFLITGSVEVSQNPDIWATDTDKSFFLSIRFFFWIVSFNSKSWLEVFKFQILF